MRLLVPALVAVSTGLTAHPQTLLLPQPNTPLPAFEVATIKPASVTYIGILVKPSGRVEGGNCPVLYLVEEAFRAPKSLVTGGPDWINATRFDIEAVPPDDSPARRYIPPAINSPMIDQQRLMLQALLRDRFGFRYHVEKTEQPVFFLQRSGRPLKLNPPKDPNGRPFMGVIIYADGAGSGEIEGTNTTMTYTAFRLSEVLKRTVIDQTGLSGAWDFHVDAPDEKNADLTNATIEGMKTLGLELKSGKAPVDTIVIDKVTQPTPN
jgi:uncharacterized protein (TIGR03435 family)